MSDTSPYRIVYQDGAFLPDDEARLSPYDETVRFGFSLYETVRLHAGTRTFRLDRHLARLAASASHFRLGPAPALDEIRSVATRLCEENRITTGRLRIALAARQPGEEASLLVTASPYAPPEREDGDEGWRGLQVPFPRILDAPTTGHKCGNGLDVHLFRRALAPCEEGLLLNDAGRLCEGCYTNLFLVRDGEVLTPGLDQGCLPGVTRESVLGLCRGKGLPFDEGGFVWADLVSAGEAFLTNALIGVAPLTRVEGARIGEGLVGPVTAWLREAYVALVEREGK